MTSDTARIVLPGGLSESAKVLDYIKATGYKYSTRAAITVSVADVSVPPEKKAILAEADEKVVLSCRNIPNANVATADTLNTYDLVVSDKVIFTKDAIKKIEEACK